MTDVVVVSTLFGLEIPLKLYDYHTTYTDLCKKRNKITNIFSELI